jgi:hypothetical protein
MDGCPLALSNTPNITNSLGGGSRPNRVPGVSEHVPHPSIAEWFDTAAFSAPPAYTFGNEPRTDGKLRMPGWQTADLAFLKNVPLKESLALQFRAEGFNVLNKTNFEQPAEVLGAPGFGTITAAWEPRQIQFALRLSF